MRGIAVGVDAGGTSTVAALSRDGSLLRTYAGESANASSRGVEGAAAEIVLTVVGTLEGELPDAIVVGAAGAGREEVARGLESSLRTRFPDAKVRVTDDAQIALRAAVREGPGAVLIAGTGSFAYAQRGSEGYRAGGYGYLLGDDGSGFSIGSAALHHLLRSYDERAARDDFTRRLEAHLGTRGVADTLARVYGQPQAIAFVASLAPLVIDAASQGERAANAIVQRAALELAEMLKSLVKRAGLNELQAPIVFAGGLLARNSLLSFLLETRLHNDLPNMPIKKDPAPPHLGALAAAEDLLTHD